MSSDTLTLTFSQIVEAKPARVYSAFTSATCLREWFCDIATLDAKPGGRLYMAWNDGYYTAGEFLELIPNEKIVFLWRGRNEPTETNVQIELETQNDATLITVAHSKIGTDSGWSNTVGEFSTGWKASLENLASVLETGQDIRFVRRPMLGIAISDFNEEIARQLGVPVEAGLRIDDVISGMGAEAAGLQSNDVIISMDGKPLTDWPSLSAILQSHYSGDKLEVIAYRGAEKKTFMMELSQRRIPPIPDTLEELAKQVKLRSVNTISQIDQFFDGINDSEASIQPEPGEWSVKQTLAHLILGERGWQTWIADLIGGNEAHYDDYNGNLQASLDALVSTYADLSSLVAELKRAHNETAALFTRIPSEFMRRKGSFWRLAYNALEEPFHLHTHFEQMQETLAIARQQ